MGITKAFLLEPRSLTVMFCLLSDVKNCEDVFWVLCELQTTILLPLSPYWELYKHNQTHKHQRAAAASHWWRATRRKHLSARELNTAISVEAWDRKWSITGGIWMETALKMTRTFHNPTQLQRPWRHRHHQWKWRKTLSFRVETVRCEWWDLTASHRVPSAWNTSQNSPDGGKLWGL